MTTYLDERTDVDLEAWMNREIELICELKRPPIEGGHRCDLPAEWIVIVVNPCHTNQKSFLACDYCHGNIVRLGIACGDCRAEVEIRSIERLK